MNEDKSRLEQKVMEGAFGAPELKLEEKNRFLGEYQERVICYLSYDQVREPWIYPEVLEAIRDERAKKLIVNRRVELSHAQNYINLARKHKLAFKRVDSPRFQGDTALVVAADHAVEIGQRKILARRERLQKKGISDTIIKNVGAVLCESCWQELKEKAPEELVNYKKMTWLDRLFGTNCINCH